MRFQRHATRTKPIARWNQFGGQFRALDAGPHFFANKSRNVSVDVFIDQNLGEATHPEGQRAVMPQLFQRVPALSRCQGVIAAAFEVEIETGESVVDALLEFIEARMQLFVVRFVPAPIVHLNCVLRRTLEYFELRDQWRDGLNHLNPSGAGTHHADTLAFKHYWSFRPTGGVIQLAPEALLTGEQIRQRRRQHARAAHYELRSHPVAAIGFNVPATAVVVVTQAGHPRAELNVVPQSTAVGDEIDVAFELGLSAKTLAPSPILMDFFREPVLINMRL